MSIAETNGPLYQRWWKVWPFPACCVPCNSVLHPCRASVSQNKNRFRQDGFDLDLTYITDRIIVHGFPATGVEHFYRNPRTEVQRLLDKYHENHYKVYNFANEPGRTYPAQLFNGRVERYPFTDHTCPPLESVVEFCEDAKAWLDMDEDNVVSLHCKAGKGRAGIMAACLMVRLGETAQAAVTKFDSTRVSDLKGLTVVNQRKWAFLYERVIKEVWGLQNSIGMVPGQDPDLTAPKLRATCIREVSVQLQSNNAAGKPNDGLLPNLSLAMYQQAPMGKMLVHRSKLTRMAPAAGEPGIVYAVALPRSAAVQGTFQVLLSAAIGAAATQRDVMDLWWNTTFLDPGGGEHVFDLMDMDVSPMKLATRLHQAGARVVFRFTHPHAASPPRHVPLKRQLAAPDHGHVSHDALREAAAFLDGGRDAAGSCRSEPSGTMGGDAQGEGSGNEEVAPEGDADAMNEQKKGDAEPEADAPLDNGEGADADAPLTNFADQDCSSKNVTVTDQGETVGPSPSLPGPSPAGLASPVWTFEGRVPSSKSSARANGDSAWDRAHTWGSNPGVSASAMSLPDSTSLGAEEAANYEALDERSKRRAMQRYHAGSESLPSPRSRTYSPSSAAAGETSGAPIVAWRRAPRDSVHASGRLGKRGLVNDDGFAFPLHRETDSDSEDQVGVRASAFGGRDDDFGGDEGRGGGKHFALGPATGSSSNRGQQWAMEMEMTFAKERRRWEEHRQCLETELDWALAARARAEARSEEDSARVEVLETRLSAWRSEYTVIERDVKQAVGLLEMSLSGLMSAENALRRWKSHIPDEAFEDILACLTKGETASKAGSFEEV